MDGIAPITGVSGAPAASAVSGGGFTPADQMKWPGGATPALVDSKTMDMLKQNAMKATSELEKAQSEMPQPMTQEQIVKGTQAASDFQEKRNAEIQAMLPKPPKPYTEDDWNVHPKQAEMFLPLMMGLAALSGSRTGDPTIGTLNSMNAVMGAQIAGNKEFADHHYQQMKDQFTQAMQLYNQQMESIKPIVMSLSAGSPESNQALRLELIKQGIPISQVEQIMSGDTTGNAIKFIDAKEKYANQALNMMAQFQAKEDTNRAKVTASGAGQNPLTPEASDLLDELATRDPSFMSRMGVKSIGERNRIINDWAREGKTSDDIISGRIGLKSNIKEVQILSGQKGSLDRVENALVMKGGIGDQVIDAAKKINPSKLRQYNKISQFLQTEQSDPDLANYRVKLISLRDEFATVINKGGQPTEGSRAQASEIMDKYAPTAIESIVNAVKDVVGANKRAIDKSLRDAEGGTTSPSGGGASNLPAGFTVLP